MNKIINFKYGKIVPPTAGSIRKILVATGEYQDYIIEWAKKIGKANSVILDVGANIGCHTIPFAQLFDGSCEVYAFEPEPEAHDILSENIKLNNLTNVRIIKKGLSNETKKQEFFINPHSGGSTLSPNPEHGTDQSNPIDIDTIKLDDLNLMATTSTSGNPLFTQPIAIDDGVNYLWCPSIYSNSANIQYIDEALSVNTQYPLFHDTSLTSNTHRPILKESALNPPKFNKLNYLEFAQNKYLVGTPSSLGF